VEESSGDCQKYYCLYTGIITVKLQMRPRLNNQYLLRLNEGFSYKDSDQIEHTAVDCCFSKNFWEFRIFPTCYLANLCDDVKLVTFSSETA